MEGSYGEDRAKQLNEKDTAADATLVYYSEPVHIEQDIEVTPEAEQEGVLRTTVKLTASKSNLHLEFPLEFKLRADIH